MSKLITSFYVPAVCLPTLTTRLMVFPVIASILSLTHLPLTELCTNRESSLSGKCFA